MFKVIEDFKGNLTVSRFSRAKYGRGTYGGHVIEVF